MPNTSSLLAVHAAVYALLVADSALETLVGGPDRIQNYEPEEPPSEFIVIGNATEESWNTLGGMDAGWGWEDTITVHLYSYYKGDLKVFQMLERVTVLLNRPDGIVIPGYATVMCEYGMKVTRALIETKDKQERRHIPAIFSLRLHE